MRASLVSMAALVGGGVLGIMPPSQTAWLHNLFTLGIGLESMTPLLKKEEQKENCSYN